MAWPYAFASSWDFSGTLAGFGFETDTASQIDAPSYRDLAAIASPRNLAPFSGSHCGRARLTGGTADAFWRQSTNIAIANGEQQFARFQMYIAEDFTATEDDEVNIFQWQGAAAAVQVNFGLEITASTDNVLGYIGNTGNDEIGTRTLTKGVWHTVELEANLGTATDGTIDLFITEEGQAAETTAYATQITGIDQVAVIQFVIGIQDHLATTTGTILFDNLVIGEVDTARVFPLLNRWPTSKTMTASGCAFVGPGRVTNFSMISDDGGGTGNVVSLYDTDTGDTNGSDNAVYRLKGIASNDNVVASGMPKDFKHGCFVNLEGSHGALASADITFERTPVYGSVGALRSYGAKSR